MSASPSVKDPRTGAYTLDYFGDLASREIDRAERYRRRFALLTVSLEARQPPSEGDEQGVAIEANEGVIRLLATALADVVRDSDVVARVADQEFYVLLPETGLLGAMACRHRLLEHLSTTAAQDHETHTGVAVYPMDGEDLGRLIRTSRRRARRSAPKNLLRYSPTTSFWDLVAGLLNNPEAPFSEDPDAEGTPTQQSSLGGIRRSSIAYLTELMVAHTRTQQLEGTLYVFGDQTAALASVHALERSPEGPFRAWCLDGTGDCPSPYHLPVADARLEAYLGVLGLTDSFALALIGRHASDNEVHAYKTADIAIVDTLIRAIQREYSLQPGLRG